MLINWFTVAAQIVNFLVLVWLLKRFLFGRIIAAIGARESKIDASVAEAESKEKAAAEQLALYQARLAEIETQREELLAQARRDAEKLHGSLADAAREHAQALKTQWQKDLDHERTAFLRDLRSRAGAEILAVARRTVGDLACLDVQQCAVRNFLNKLRTLDPATLSQLGTGDLLLRTAVELPRDLQAEIQRAIQTQLERPVALRLERAPELVVGVELRGNGQRIGWNAESYLEMLERDLSEALEQQPAGVA